MNLYRGFETCESVEMEMDSHNPSEMKNMDELEMKKSNRFTNEKNSGNELYSTHNNAPRHRKSFKRQKALQIQKNFQNKRRSHKGHYTKVFHISRKPVLFFYNAYSFDWNILSRFRGNTLINGKHTPLRWFREN